MNTKTNLFAETPKTLSVVLITMLASPLAISADENWYNGASFGQSHASLRFNSAVLSTLPSGATITDLYYDDRDAGFKLFGGYQFNTNFALEAGYFDLGKIDFNSSSNPLGTSNGYFEINGWNLDMVATIPLIGNLDLLARAGFNYADTTTAFQGTGIVPNHSPTLTSSDWNPKLGIGLQYAVTERLDIRLEAERFHLDEPVLHKGDVDLISLGLVYRFNQKSVARRKASSTPVRPTAARTARATPPPAATPAPTPTPPPAPTRVVFSVDSLFDFDQSVIRDSGKQSLDKLIADLRGTSFDLIRVTGHTDRIGTREYNLDLSKRRADAVKDYLVQTGNIPAAKITTRGVDGADSMIGPNDCRDDLATDALISCLQPDRRVEVEVTATR